MSVKRYPKGAIDFVDGEQVWADVVLAREYDALAARLAAAERLLRKLGAGFEYEQGADRMPQPGADGQTAPISNEGLV